MWVGVESGNVPSRKAIAKAGIRRGVHDRVRATEMEASRGGAGRPQGRTSTTFHAKQAMTFAEIETAVCRGSKSSHNVRKACGCSRQAPSAYRLRLVSVLGRRAGTTPSTGTCCRDERIQAASARTFLRRRCRRGRSSGSASDLRAER